jgi:polyphenol oxidase
MFSIYYNYNEVMVAVSTKRDGPMGLARQVEKDKAIREQREKYLMKFSVGIEQVATASLVHGNTVAIVRTRDAGRVIPDVDALTTKDKNIFLSITVADCLPIFYFDPVKKIVALAHAGWRGVLSEISRKVVRTMTELGSNPGDILVGIGPHICAEHYEVKTDMADQFAKYGGGVIIQRQGLIFLDLAKAVTAQLLGSGIRPSNIEISNDCTFSLNNQYYSYRRDKPENLETMLAIFGMRGGI